MTAGVLDALLDQLAWLPAHGQCGSQQFAQRRTVRQRLDMFRIELARTRPLAHFVTQPRWQHRLAAQGPATLQHDRQRSEEHTSELQSLMRISYAVFCLK